MDDMAGIGGLSEIDLDSMSDAEADVETVKQEEDEIDLGELSKSADAAPVIKLTNVLLVDSLKRGASDIHIEPYEKEFRVRFRIDGILYNVMALPMKLQGPADLPHQDHGQAGHRREATPPGRPDQDQDAGSRTAPATSTSASRACPRCGARRSSCGCWTSRSSCST